VRILLLLAALIRGPADVEALTAASDVVVRAQVVSRTSAYGVKGGQIFTTVVVRPIETWKGDASGELRVLVPGGEVGDYAQTVSGMAVFGEGEEVVVFLRRGPQGVFGMQQMSLGKFSVFRQRARRDRRDIECLRCDPREQDEFSLDELRARVLRSAAR
jgi:hypothetical protein